MNVIIPYIIKIFSNKTLNGKSNKSFYNTNISHY